jgi:hypothetical protein
MPMGPFGYIGSAPYKTNGPMRSHWQKILHMPMGPSQCIGSTLCKKIVGPFEIIGSKLYIFQWAHPGASAVHRVKNSGPMRNHWQKILHIPMGPSWCFGSALCKKIVGPCEIIGSIFCVCQWAHPSASAVHHMRNNGPMQNHWQQTLHIPMGPSQYISSALCKI